MDAAQIERVAEFGEQLLAIGLTIGQTGPITDLIAPDDHDSGVRPRLQYRRQAAHETGKAAVGLQVARHIGDDFFSGSKFKKGLGASVSVWRIGLRRADRQGKRCCGIRTDDIGVDAVMNDPEH